MGNADAMQRLSCGIHRGCCGTFGEGDKCSLSARETDDKIVCGTTTANMSCLLAFLVCVKNEKIQLSFQRCWLLPRTVTTEGCYQKLFSFSQTI